MPGTLADPEAAPSRVSPVHVWNGLAEVPADLGRSVVTLGNFDGVHRGHRAVLGQLVEQATSRDATSVAVTFEPHPLAVLFPERAPTPLTSPAQRLELLAGSGLDAVLVMEFTLEFARLTPEEFVEQVFVRGTPRRSGDRRRGHPVRLEELRQRRHAAPSSVPPTTSTSSSSTTSATASAGPPRWRARSSRSGDVEGAAAMLGRPHQRHAARSSTATTAGASSASRPRTSAVDRGPGPC